MKEKIRWEFHRKQKRLWIYFYTTAIISLILFLSEKIFGKIEILKDVFIGLVLIMFNIFIINILSLGIFSIKNKIASLNVGWVGLSQEHYGWQAVLTGIFCILIALFFLGLEIFILVSILS